GRGRGMATEAVTMLVRHAMIPTEDGGLGLRRLVLGAATANGASRRVAQKAGFRQTGTARAAERLGDGSFVDLARYDLLAGEVI
ncbi:MAG: GNAT family N-acetyltransferase, partial [Nocardioidaceae bacterium]